MELNGLFYCVKLPLMEVITTHWNQIKQDYVHSDVTVNELAAKYKIKPASIRYHIKKHRWIKEQDKDDTLARIMNVADDLLNKIETAAGQLDTYMLKKKIKTKTISYFEDNGKTEREVIEENEKIQMIKGIIDKNELKILCSVLKDLKSVYTNKDDDSAQGKLEMLLKGLNDENI